MEKVEWTHPLSNPTTTTFYKVGGGGGGVTGLAASKVELYEFGPAIQGAPTILAERDRYPSRSHPYGTGIAHTREAPSPCTMFHFRSIGGNGEVQARFGE